MRAGRSRRAGFLAHADHHIGRLLDYLEESGRRDNTMVIVVSDNRASGEVPRQRPAHNQVSGAVRVHDLLLAEAEQALEAAPDALPSPVPSLSRHPIVVHIRHCVARKSLGGGWLWQR